VDQRFIDTMIKHTASLRLEEAGEGLGPDEVAREQHQQEQDDRRERSSSRKSQRHRMKITKQPVRVETPVSPVGVETPVSPAAPPWTVTNKPKLKPLAISHV
jgi:hypothetical protein